MLWLIACTVFERISEFYSFLPCKYRTGVVCRSFPLLVAPCLLIMSRSWQPCHKTSDSGCLVKMYLNKAPKAGMLATGVTRLLLLAAVLQIFLLLSIKQWWTLHRITNSPGCIERPLMNCTEANDKCPAQWLGQPTALDPMDCTPQLLIIGTIKGGASAAFKYLNNR